MATLNYDKDLKFLWATLDDGSTIPIYTLLNLEKTLLRVTDAGLLLVYNNQSKEYENIEGPSLKGPIGNTIQLELGTITTSENANASLIKSGDGLTAILNLSLPKGDPGPQGPKGDEGAPGKVLYTWIKYADDENGSGLSDSPISSSGPKSYIGFAYNKEDPTESNNASDYKWTLIKGADGTDGIPGEKGENGTTYYTWIKYSDRYPESDDDLYESPAETTEYIGIATNQIELLESNNYALYSWSKFKGDKGVTGDKGDKGDKGDPGENGKDLTFMTDFPDDAVEGDVVFWNGPSIETNQVPCGYTERGELYYYLNSDGVNDSLNKRTNITISYGTNVEDVKQMDSTTGIGLLNDLNMLEKKAILNTFNRMKRFGKYFENGAVKYDFSNITTTSSNSPLKMFISLYTEGRSISGDHLSSRERVLKAYAEYVLENPEVYFYVVEYSTDVSLNADTCYWYPKSSLDSFN